MAKDEQKTTEDRGQKAENELLKKACKAFGIAAQFVFASKVHDDGRVVIVTNGGSKVSWQEGDEAEPLDPIQIDGIVRKKMKVIAGKKKD